MSTKRYIISDNTIKLGTKKTTVSYKTAFTIGRRVATKKILF